MIRKIVLVVALVVVGYSLKAEGFAVNVQGNKQTGMGHVGTALNWDASCLQFNPGALATLKNKFSLSAGGFFTFTQTEFTSGQSLLKEESNNPMGTPFYLYGSYKLNDDLAFGLGVYTPFGNTVDWGKEWSGKYLMQDIVLKGIYIQPTVSYKLAPWVSVGAGLNIVYGSFDLNKKLPLTSMGVPDGTVNISGKKVEMGYNVGVFIQPTDKLNVGVSYRSQVDVELGYGEGEADFDVHQGVAGLFPDGPVKATLPLPASFNVGVAYQLSPKWVVSADVNFVKWDEYNALNFDFETNTSVPGPGGVTVPVLTDSKNKREWDNSVTYRVGAQYSACDKLDLRAGFYYDQTPTNEKYYSPETPGADKIGISTGFSYKVGDHLSIDGSLLYINGEKRTAYDTNDFSVAVYGSEGFGGEFKNKGWIPGIGITYNF